MKKECKLPIYKENNLLVHVQSIVFVCLKTKLIHIAKANSQFSHSSCTQQMKNVSLENCQIPASQTRTCEFTSSLCHFCVQHSIASKLRWRYGLLDHQVKDLLANKTAPMFLSQLDGCTVNASENKPWLRYLFCSLLLNFWGQSKLLQKSKLIATGLVFHNQKT